MMFRLPHRVLSAILSLPFALLALAEAPVPIAGGFTLAVLPDTQIYAWKHPDTYPAQTRWLADHAKRYNLRYVLHVGDITQHNTNTQWQVAARARVAGCRRPALRHHHGQP